MDLTRRFIFHGDAVAIGGRIVRPEDIVLDPKCASVLPVTGGRTSSRLKGMKFGRYVRFEGASTLAEGSFDNRRQAVALTHGKGREEELATTTTVRAELLGLTVGIGPRLTVRRLRGSLTAKSAAPADAETSVALGSDTTFDGIAIDGYKLSVEVNKTLFQRHDTYSKLKAAAGDAAVMKEHATSLLAGATVNGQPHAGGLVEVRGLVHGTIVRSVRWSGKPYPGATIDGHVVTIPEFGRIYFGEILISRDARRVSMMRLKLGSPMGGYGECCGYQDNGGWSP